MDQHDADNRPFRANEQTSARVSVRDAGQAGPADRPQDEQRISLKSLAKTTCAHVVPGSARAAARMAGAFDGSNQDHYFPVVNGAHQSRLALWAGRLCRREAEPGTFIISLHGR